MRKKKDHITSSDTPPVHIPPVESSWALMREKLDTHLPIQPGPMAPEAIQIAKGLKGLSKVRGIFGGMFGGIFSITFSTIFIAATAMILIATLWFTVPKFMSHRQGPPNKMDRQEVRQDARQNTRQDARSETRSEDPSEDSSEDPSDARTPATGRNAANQEAEARGPLTKTGSPAEKASGSPIIPIPSNPASSNSAASNSAASNSAASNSAVSNSATSNSAASNSAASNSAASNSAASNSAASNSTVSNSAALPSAGSTLAPSTPHPSTTHPSKKGSQIRTRSTPISQIAGDARSPAGTGTRGTAASLKNDGGIHEAYTRAGRLSFSGHAYSHSGTREITRSPVGTGPSPFFYSRIDSMLRAGRNSRRSPLASSLTAKPPSALQMRQPRAMTAGISLSQDLPIAGQRSAAYNISGKGNILSDYLPGLYFTYPLADRLTLRAGLHFNSPQYTRPMLIDSSGDSSRIPGWQQDIQINAVTLKKLYYTDIPLTLQFRVKGGLHVTAGVQFSRVWGGVAGQEVIMHPTNGLGKDTLFSSSVIRLKDNGHAYGQIRKNDWRILLGAGYTWKKWTIDLQYRQALTPYLPALPGGKPGSEKNNSFGLSVYFDLWQRPIRQ